MKKKPVLKSFVWLGVAGLLGLLYGSYAEVRQANQEANQRWADRLSEMVASESGSLEWWVNQIPMETATLRDIINSRPGVSAIFLDEPKKHTIQSWVSEPLKGRLRPFEPWLVVIELKALETAKTRVRPLIFIQGRPYSTVLRPAGRHRVLLVFLSADRLASLLRSEADLWHLNARIYDYEKNPVFATANPVIPSSAIEQVLQRIGQGRRTGALGPVGPKPWQWVATFHYDPASDWIFLIARRAMWVYAPLLLSLVIALALVFLYRLPHRAASRLSQETLKQDLSGFGARVHAYIHGREPILHEPPSRYAMLNPVVQAVRRMVEEREKTELIADELALERQLLGLLVESLPEGILFFNEKGALQLSNEAGRVFLALEQNGRASKVIGGMQIPQGFLEPYLEPVFSGRQPNAGKEVEVSWADGKHLYRIWVERVETEPEKSMGYIVVVRDITFRKQWEYVQEQVLSGITHDLRGPLSAVLGYLDLMRRHMTGELPPKLREYLQLTRESAMRLSQMVNDILDVVRFEQGKIDMAPEETPASELFQRLKNTFGVSAEQKGITLQCSAANGEDVKVWADRRLLERVLDNLVGNAIKFTSKNGQIIVFVKPERDRVTFTVTDNGRGIPREAQSRIFDKFQQVSPGDRSTGYGLGLAVAKFIVDAHQGEIRVESEVSAGSRFTFWLPNKSQSTIQPVRPLAA